MTNTERAEALRKLFAEWQEQDAQRTPEEVAAEDAAWAEVERGLAENPVNMRRVDVSDHD